MLKKLTSGAVCRKLAVVYSLGLIFPQQAFCSVLVPPKFDASKVRISVTSSLRFHRDTDTVSYLYNLVSSHSSVQKLSIFAFKLDAAVLESVSPAGWDGGLYSNQPIWSWSANDENFLVEPGASHGGFSLISKGLPGIHEYYAQGDSSIPSVDDVPDGISEQDFAQALSVTHNSSRGYTVSPDVTKTDCSPIKILEFIESQTKMAATVDWIEGGGILFSLDSKLDSAERALGFVWE